MFKVTFAFENGSKVEVFANAGDNLLEVARGANVAIDAPCSGNGACGKCRVQLKGGELDSKKTLHISDGYRRNLGVVVAGHALFHIGGSGFHSSFRRCGAQRNCSRGSA